jgi:hypothetical protein
MAKTNYFQDMTNKYQGNEDWVNMITGQEIQKSAVKRIFKEMINGAYDYGKYGHYFLDAKFLDNLMVAATSKLEYYTLLSNAIIMYRDYDANYPNIGFHFTHVQNLRYIYYTLYSVLDNVKDTYNVSALLDITSYLYNYRNDINNE